MFTHDNTYGYSDAELAEFNAARAELISGLDTDDSNFHSHDQNIAAALHNAFGPDCNTAAALVAACRRLGF